jgi:hypothetical protein
LATVLPADRQDAFQRIDAAWRARNEDVFLHSVRALSAQLAAIAADGEAVPTAGLGESAKAWLRSAVTGGERRDEALDRATRLLTERADGRIRQATDELIGLHGLSGSAAAQVEARMSADFSIDKAASRGKAGMLGAAVSGALGGLAADLATGGLTLGGGALVGALVGAAGAAGLAHGYNVLRGTDASTVRWDGAVLTRLVNAAALRYLAVAHFGRGRGDYVESEYPAHWRPVVDAAVLAEEAALARVWMLAEAATPASALQPELERTIASVLRSTLATLYRVD